MKSLLWAACRALPQPHQLVGRAALSAAGERATFSCRLSRPELSYMWQHQIGGRAIMPGAGMLEACTAAGATLAHDGQGMAGPLLALQAVSIAAPMPLDFARTESLVLESSVTLATGAVQLSSIQSGSRSVLSCRATLATVAPAIVPSSTERGASIQPTVFAFLFGDVLGVRPSRSISADVRVSGPHLAGYLVHPTAMDATLHLTAAAPPSGPAKSEGTKVPTGLACLLVRLDAAPSRAVHPLAVPDAAPAPGSGHRCSFQMLQPPAPAAFTITDLLVKQLPAPVAAPAPSPAPAVAVPTPADSSALYEIQWQAASSSAAVDAAAPPPGGASWRLTRSAEAATAPVLAGSALTVDFASAGSRLSTTNGSSSTLRGLEMLQRLPPGGTLAVRTRGAFVAAPSAALQGTAADSAASAAVAALARVAANELPSAHITSLDAHPSVPNAGVSSEVTAQFHCCRAHIRSDQVDRLAFDACKMLWLR